MYAYALIVSLLAALGAIGAPTPAEDANPAAAYKWNVKRFSYGCSPGGCAWSFDISGPDNDTYPPFKTHCSGTGYDKKYVPCKVISPEQSAYGKVKNTDYGEITVFFEYVVDFPPPETHIAYGNTTQSLSSLQKRFSIVPSRFT